MPATRQRSDRFAPREHQVLILSHDPIAAALLGALVETLGYEVQFGRPPESPDDALRRVKPRVCLVDCSEPESCRAEFFGRATMRGVCIVIFGPPAALERLRELARTHDLEMLLMPPEVEVLEALLQRAGDA